MGCSRRPPRIVSQLGCTTKLLNNRLHEITVAPAMLLKSFSQQESQVRRDTYVVLLLCLCVALQMLGVPATLLSPAASSNLVSDVNLEGWSLPSTSLNLSVNSQSGIPSSAPFMVYLTIFLTSVFHPPLVTFLYSIFT